MVPREDKDRGRMMEGRGGKEEDMEHSIVARGNMAMGLTTACSLGGREEGQQQGSRKDRRWVPRLRDCGGV